VVTVIDVPLSVLPYGTTVPPIVTLVPPAPATAARPVPVMVTLAPPPVGPEDGLMLVMVGGGAYA
jgi:hypothetical protein